MFRREKIPYIAVAKPVDPRFQKVRARLRKAVFPITSALIFIATTGAGYVLDGNAYRAGSRLQGARAMLDDARQDAGKLHALGAVFLDLARVRTFLDIGTARRALVDDPVVGKVDYATFERLQGAFFDGPAREAYIDRSLARIGIDRTPGILETIAGPSSTRPEYAPQPDVLADLVARNLVLGDAVAACRSKVSMKNCLPDEIAARAGHIRKEFEK